MRIPSLLPKHCLLNILAFALAYLFILMPNAARIPAFERAQNHYWNGQHLITNVDGYYFLRIAEEVREGKYTAADPLSPGLRPENAPPLSILTAGIQFLTGAGMMDIAFYLPPLLAGLAVILYWVMARYVGSPSIGVMAAMLSTTAHIWVLRTKPGWFDTDCLNPTLFWLVVTCLALSANRQRIRDKGLWLAAALSAVAGLYFWWPTGAGPLIGIAAMAYVASLALPSQRKAERIAKLAALPIGGIVGAAVVTGIIPDFLPETISRTLTSLHAHYVLAFKGSLDIFPETGTSIAELSIFPFGEFVRELSGHWGVFVLAVTGLCHLFVRRRDACIFLGIPTLILGVLAFTAGNRFIIFLVPPHAVGLAWFLRHIVFDLLKNVSTSFGVAYALAFGGILLIPGLQFTLSEPLEPVMDANMALLFSKTAEETTPDTLIWSQWGLGYGIQYYAKRRVLVDGGSQTPRLVYISEAPFASSDVEFSRNWIRFFSNHINGIEQVAKWLETDQRNALIFLRQGLKNPDLAKQELLNRGKKELIPRMLPWLFPETANTTVVFSSDMLFRTVWVSKGLWDPVTGKLPETPLYAYPSKNLTIDRKKGTFIYGSKIIPYSKLMFVTAKELSHDVKRSRGPIAILVKGNKFGFMIQKEYFENLGFRLLFVFPDKTPKFRPLAYHPYVGGAWKVE